MLNLAPVCILALLPLAKGECFTAEERVPLDPLIGKVNIQHYDYFESITLSTMAKVVMTEILGIDVELHEVEYDSEETYLDFINKGEHDINLGAYATSLIIDTYPNVISIGNVGYEEFSSWYVPDYLVNSAPEIMSLKGFGQIFDQTQLFCHDVVDYDSYVNFKTQVNGLLSGECSGSLTDVQKDECLQKIEQYNDIPKKCRLEFLSTPDDIDWSYNKYIIENNNINAYVNITYAREEDDDLDVDEQLYDFAKKHHDAKRPFLVHLFEPSAAISKLAGINLVQVSLPKYDSECRQIYNGENELNSRYDCAYPIEIMTKLMSAEFEERVPVAYRFLSEFFVNGNEDLNDMVFEQKNGTEVEEVVCQYLKSNRDKWSVPKKDISREIKISSGLSISMISFGSIFAVVALTHAIGTIIFRKNLNIKTSSFPFLFLISLGSCISFLYVVILFLTPTNVTCIVETSLEILGFFAVLVALILKTARISILFKSIKPSKMQRRAVKQMTEKRLLGIYSILMLAVCIFITIFMSVSKPAPYYNVLSSTNNGEFILTEYEIYCKGSVDIFPILFIIFQAVLALLGSFLAFSIRKTPSVFNESVYIGAAMYNLLMCLVVKYIVYFLSGSTLQTKYLVTSIFTILSVTVILILVVSKKFIYIMQGLVPDVSNIYRSSSDKTRSSRVASRTVRNTTNTKQPSRRGSISELKIYNDNGTSRTLVIDEGEHTVQSINEVAGGHDMEEQETSVEILGMFDSGVYDG